jgi:cytochrome c553
MKEQVAFHILSGFNSRLVFNQLWFEKGKMARGASDKMPPQKAALTGIMPETGVGLIWAGRLPGWLGPAQPGEAINWVISPKRNDEKPPFSVKGNGRSGISLTFACIYPLGRSIAYSCPHTGGPMRAKVIVHSLTLLAFLFVSVAVAQDDGAQIYSKNCLKCHGAEGKGDGPAAKLIKNLSMGDFSNAEAMSKYSDDDLYKLISEGGEAVGKSKIMPAYKGKLSDAEISAVVNYVKTLHQ